MSRRPILLASLGTLLLPGACATDHRPGNPPMSIEPTAGEPAPSLAAETPAPSAPDPLPQLLEQGAELVALLRGSWRTETPQGPIVLSIAPYPVAGRGMTLYAETAFENSLHRPFRQIVLEVLPVGSDLRLRTYESRGPGGRFPHLVGLWLLPGFPYQIPEDLLVPTLDVSLARRPDGSFAGASPHPYPTIIGGAVEMTARLEVSAASMRTLDLGVDETGAEVWDQTGGQGLLWSRVNLPVDVSQTPDGLAIIDFVRGSGPEFGQGTRVMLNYTGWLETGSVFDSNTLRGNRPTMIVYPGSNMRQGWTDGLPGISKGTIRRLVVPPPLGFGELGGPGVPPNAWLFYEFECLDVQPVEASGPSS